MTFSSSAMMATFLLATFYSQLAAAQTPEATTVSFTPVIFPAVPKIDVNISFKGCAQLPDQVTAFSALNTKAVFAIYQDDACKNYLYSVEGSLVNMQGVKSMSFDKIDSTNAYAQGKTFMDSTISSQPANRNVLIAMVVSGAVFFFAVGGAALWFMERKKKAKLSNKVSVSGAGLPVYASKSQEATVRHVSSSYPASSASSVSYLPAYNITTTTTTYTSA
ncbi:hypothetical protein EC957_002828 [Mortierella hygrophila]|uniref:Mid2 domain-containing protein n=1 Tax=Mortierella hygrophila TaxID=979708 RepID=A0A9P6FEZ2_9FUNG|nr:hypothetical protein EC957_002828 [Mortierella hygrophila]